LLVYNKVQLDNVHDSYT